MSEDAAPYQTTHSIVASQLETLLINLESQRDQLNREIERLKAIIKEQQKLRD